MGSGNLGHGQLLSAAKQQVVQAGIEELKLEIIDFMRQIGHPTEQSATFQLFPGMWILYDAQALKDHIAAKGSLIQPPSELLSELEVPRAREQ